MSDSEGHEQAARDWPARVTPISWNNIGRLGVGQDGQLYWDGRPVVTRSRLNLSSWQRFLAAFTAAAIIAGGFGGLMAGVDAGHHFGCQVHWWTDGCKP